MTVSFILQQYSAQLIQYKFDSFGGFKLDKVLEEIKRGKFLVRLKKLFSIPFKGPCNHFCVCHLCTLTWCHLFQNDWRSNKTNLVYIIRICEFDANPKFSMATKANNVTSSVEIQNSLFSRNHLVVWNLINVWMILWWSFMFLC